MNHNQSTYRDALETAEDLLQSRYELNYIQSISYIAESLNISTQQLLQNLDKPIPLNKHTSLERFVQKLDADIPLAYILGNIDFYDENYHVNPQVLIPRADSELLVELILQEIQPSSHNKQALEIGFGSGCISISILNNSPSNLRIDAIDISQKAQNVAIANALRILGDDKSRINFEVNDIFDYEPKHSYDYIISNPPYIPVDEYRLLDHSLSYEPRIALTDDSDGLSFYARLREITDKYLTKDGVAFFELHSNNAASTTTIFTRHSKFTTKIHKDLSGKDRVIEIRRTTV